MFLVQLLQIPITQSQIATKEITDNCTFVAPGLWIYEGDIDVLVLAGVHLKVLDTGVVGSLGDLSQSELIQLCKDTFEFNHSLIKVL